MLRFIIMIKIVKIVNWIYLLLTLFGAGLLFIAQQTKFDGKIVLYSIPFILALLAFRPDSNAKTRWAAIVVNGLVSVVSLISLPAFLLSNLPVLFALIPILFLIPTGVNCYYVYRRHIKLKLMLKEEIGPSEEPVQNA